MLSVATSDLPYLIFVFHHNRFSQLDSCANTDIQTDAHAHKTYPFVRDASTPSPYHSTTLTLSPLPLHTVNPNSKHKEIFDQVVCIGLSKALFKDSQPFQLWMNISDRPVKSIFSEIRSFSFNRRDNF